MSQEMPDDFVAGIIRRAIVAKGFRARSEQELDAALEALGDVEISADKAKDILAKIRSDEPILFFCDADESSDVSMSKPSEELVEMFKAEGEDLPPEIEERLRELEKLAEEEAEELDEDDSDDE